MIPSIYINLDDDVSKIIERIKKERASELVLVCPKRCFLFNDSINLRLLKKQTDLVKKTVHILTMDERGQTYAKEAGFTLKFLPGKPKINSMSDIGQGRNIKHSETTEIKISQEKEVPKKDKARKPIQINRVVKKNVSNSESLVETGISKKDETHFKNTHTPKVEVLDNIFPVELETNIQHEKKVSSLWKIILGFLLVSVAVAVVLLLYILPKGQVTIYPKSESLVRDLEISASQAITAPDPTKLLLPANKIDQTITITQKFESKGKKEVGSKASGSVKIYNFTKLPLNLKASTTSLKLAGKTYVLKNDVNALRPTLYINSKTKEVDETSLGGPFEIIATEGGEDANIPGDTRMEITNLVLGSKPQVVYAKTVDAVSGGTTRYLSYVSDTDIEEARAQLVKSAFDQIQQKLAETNLSLAEDGYVMEIKNFATNKPSGSESPSFEASLDVRFSGLAINIEDLYKLVKDRVNQTMADNKSLDISEGIKQISYKFKEIDPKFELGVLLVHFQGKVWYNLSDNLQNYPKQFLGKTPEEINEILNKDLEIDRVDITIAPSWQKTFPKILSKISIGIQRSEQ